MHKTIAQISDLHFGRIDPPVAEALVGELHELKPTLLVVSGDFTQRARRRQYEQAAAYLGRLPRPQLVVPGNHDVPLYDVFRRVFYPLSRYRHYITRDLRPVFKDESLLVMGMNTARRLVWPGWYPSTKDGAISEEQLLDIRLHTKELPPHFFRVVVTHHPFIPPPGERLKGMVAGAGRALDEMEQARVDLVLSGHLHMGYSGDVRTHYEAVKRSILAVQAGTATSTRRRGEPNAYNFITIRQNQVDLSVRSWKGSRFEQSTFERFRRTEGVWQLEASDES